MTLQEPADPKSVYHEYHDGWGFGFVSDGRADLNQACPHNRIAKIRNYTSLEDAMLGTLFLGIYLPHTTTITCAAEVQNAAK
ncbi:MAG: hypothetical protein AB7N80_05320 [Bdellovibrionales bacterium]